MTDLVRLIDPLPVDRIALQAVLTRRTSQRTGPDRLSRRQGGGLLAGTAAEEREILEADLHAILKGRQPRTIGQDPIWMGRFERIAPCALLQQFQRMKR